MVDFTAFNVLTVKKSALVILFFTVISFAANAQRNNKAYLRIETAGDPGSEIKETQSGKLINLLTSSNYVVVHSVEGDGKLSIPVYYRCYYRRAIGTTNNANLPGIQVINSGPVYLSPDMEIIIDVLDVDADTVACKYSIKRPRLVPEIRFYHTGDEEPFYTLPTLGRPEQLSMNPGEINLGFTERPDFKNLEVEYLLRNQKTGESQSVTSKTGLAALNLEPKMVYELRTCYAAQRESMRTTILYVKPYWYKSAKTYIILSVFCVAAGFIWMMLFLRTSCNHQQRSSKSWSRQQSDCSRY